MGEDFVRTYKWLNDVGYEVDLEKLHKKYAEISWNKFEEWARKQYWSTINKPIEQKVI